MVQGTLEKIWGTLTKIAIILSVILNLFTFLIVVLLAVGHTLYAETVAHYLMTIN